MSIFGIIFCYKYYFWVFPIALVLYNCPLSRETPPIFFWIILFNSSIYLCLFPFYDLFCLVALLKIVLNAFWLHAYFIKTRKVSVISLLCFKLHFMHSIFYCIVIMFVCLFVACFIVLEFSEGNEDFCSCYYCSPCYQGKWHIHKFPKYFLYAWVVYFP